MINSYELAYLISPDLKEEEVQALCEKVLSLIIKLDKLAQFEKPKKIELSYPIQKKKEAFLVSTNFQAKTEDIIGLKSEIEKIPHLLRFLLIKKRRVTEKKEAEEETKKAPLKKPEKSLAAKKVELEQIEKDLEKILGFPSQDKSVVKTEQ